MVVKQGSIGCASPRGTCRCNCPPRAPHLRERPPSALSVDTPHRHAPQSACIGMLRRHVPFGRLPGHIMPRRTTLNPQLRRFEISFALSDERASKCPRAGCHGHAYQKKSHLSPFPGTMGPMAASGTKCARDGCHGSEPRLLHHVHTMEQKLPPVLVHKVVSRVNANACVSAEPGCGEYN